MTKSLIRDNTYVQTVSVIADMQQLYLFVQNTRDFSQCSVQRCNHVLWPRSTAWSYRFYVLLQVFTDLCQP